LLAKNHRLRLYHVLLGVLLIALGILTILKAFDRAFDIYMTPSALEKRFSEEKKDMILATLGGLVLENSLHRQGSKLVFTMIDEDTKISVIYDGSTPALFRENQAALIRGSYDGRVFKATQVLAKHDENYQPKGSTWQRS
jgi:cytochrome c-type biogenesis protein CcmE